MQIQELHEYQKKQHSILALDCDTSLSDAIHDMAAHGYGVIFY